jgi:hypothetical protein
VQHKLQFHHFFPKALLIKNGLTARDADDIANLTFISGKTNRKISDKPPGSYLPPLIEKQGCEPFEKQAIPLGAELLEVQAYREFLTERRSLIAKRLNEFLGIASE